MSVKTIKGRKVYMSHNIIKDCTNKLPDTKITRYLRMLMDASPFVINVTSSYVGLMVNSINKKTDYGFMSKSIAHNDREYYVEDALALITKSLHSHSTAIFPIRQYYGEVTIVMKDERLFCIEHNRFI